ncbi:Arm DNA-binding domain-containing protein [Jiella pelagia]|uniref:Arm DNA-binding domain-containing protein n=1 Tax=Jiella pelagia TaxID=2986949 RepID=A0ABY7C1H6_9HYPH|nr:Arm DNA-binding domain-containing protein [Jiella pelagia]WAP69873.1 Arm DNA-binding domain-containing protein [Jiella pelagia]
MKRAKKAAASREYPDGSPLLIADEREPGLTLKVRGRSASWILKFNGKSRTLGSLNDVGSASAARERAQAVRALLAAGDDPAAYLSGLAAGRTHDEAVALAVKRKSAAAGHWTWDDLARRYYQNLEEGDAAEDGSPIPPSADTLRDAERYLGLRDGQPGKNGKPWNTGGHHHLRGKLVTEIDLENMRNGARDARSISCARKCVNYARAAFEWALENHGGTSGLSKVKPSWRMVSPQWKPRRRNRSVEAEALAKVLHTAEIWFNRPLPGRRIDAPAADEITVAALWWLALSGQRRSASMCIRRDQVRDHPERQGWKIVAFPGAVMKSGRNHLLPVPPAVVERVLNRATLRPKGVDLAVPGDPKGQRLHRRHPPERRRRFAVFCIVSAVSTSTASSG